MKRKNVTRNALLTSILSLLLCVSMLVGTTFAWFTDEVVTGMNTIAAGNLDVELLAGGTEVDSNTKLFDDVELWEPGVVVYENLQVVNVGTLALKYQMTLNFGEENAMTEGGYKLSEVLKVAVIDKVADNATRAQVLEAAKASANVGTLSNFLLRGELLPEGQTDAATGKSDKSAEQTIVVFWEPNDNEIDNRYNANNGKTTTDGKPLHISFGVNLQATQLMYEEDSFGNDYDMMAGFVPVANTNSNGALTISTTVNDMGNGVAAQEITLDAAYQFKPTETYEQAQQSAYRYYHADFVVTADKAVPANSILLAGYYQAFCEGYNDNNWVAFTSDQEVAANTSIRLVNDTMGRTVNYEELCLFGDIEDPENVGFLCGLKDLTGENAGTTVTVQLRLYPVPAQGECAVGGGCKHPEAKCEIGEPIIIGTYSYTFGAKNVATADELAAMLTSDDDNIQVILTEDVDVSITSLGNQTPSSGEYKLGGEDTENITIDLNGHTLNITTTYWSAIGAKNPDATITIKNGSMISTGNSAGTWNAWDLRFSNCNWNFENVDFLKAVALDNAGKTTNMTNVTITDTHNDDTYALWITTEGQIVNIDGLIIDMLDATDGRGIKIDDQYVDSSSKVTLNVSNATIKTEEKSAVLVKSPAGADITLNNVDISGVAADATNAVWVDEDAAEHAALVTVSGGAAIVEP